MAQYIAKHLPDVLRNTESFKTGEVKKSLVDAFLEVDNALITDEVTMKSMAFDKN